MIVISNDRNATKRSSTEKSRELKPMSQWHKAKAGSPAVWPSVRELALSCAKIASQVPAFHYGGCQLTLLSIHINESPRGTRIKPHRHSHYEAVLILKGEAHESTPPGSLLAPGTLQLHGPNEPHAWTAPDSTLLRLGIWFTMTPSATARIPLRWPRNLQLCEEAKELLTDASSALPGRQERLSARLTLLMAPALALLDLPDRPLPALRGTEHKTSGLAPFVERFLADNLAEPLSLDDVAAQFNVSVPALTRRFRQETSASVMSRLQGMRMQKACELLRSSSLSVKEVSAAVGLPEPSYFCRCFRRAFGESPRRFSTANP